MNQKGFVYPGVHNMPVHLRKNETLSQARTFDVVNTKYREAGLCATCEAQAAYGHQCGFSYIHTPCGSCEELVQTFPVAKPNGWRAFKRGRAGA